MNNLNDQYIENANPANEMIKPPMIFKSELICVNGCISENEVENETDDDALNNNNNNNIKINDDPSISFWDIPKEIEDKYQNEKNEKKEEKEKKTPIRISQITTVVNKQNKVDNNNSAVTKRKYKKRGRKPIKKYIQKQIEVNKQISENQEKIEVAKSSPLLEDIINDNNENEINKAIEENDDDLGINNNIINKNNITVMSDEVTKVDLPINSQSITGEQFFSNKDNDPIKNIISMIEQETNNKVKEMERKLNIEQRSVENDIKLHYDKLRNDGKIKIARDINKFFLAYVSDNKIL